MASIPKKIRRPTRAHAFREPLTRERIAQTALELIDEEGLENCSMRRLGARLGVEAMALTTISPARASCSTQ